MISTDRASLTSTDRTHLTSTDRAQAMATGIDGDIVITAIGFASPLGSDIDALWARLIAGESAIRDCASGIDASPSLPAALLDAQPTPWLTGRDALGVDRTGKLAWASVASAIGRRSLDGFDRERLGVFVGTGMAGAEAIDHAAALRAQGRRTPPSTVPSSMPNGPAAVVAMQADARGPVITHAVACAASAVSIIEASHALRRDEIDCAICVGVESMFVPSALHGWLALGALAKTPTVPFGQQRTGLVLGEGATCLLLERRRPGIRSIARLMGAAVRCDASHLTRPETRGQVAALRAALRSAGLTPAQIGYCNAHGTGTPVGDAVECESMRALWGDDASRLAISSTKAAFGHQLGGAGALECALTALAIERGHLPPTVGLEPQGVDPACAGFAHVFASTDRARRIDHAISNSFAFGGTNAVLVLGRTD